MKKITFVLCCLLVFCLCACSSQDDVPAVSSSDISASDISASDVQVFDEEQMSIIGMLSENANCLVNGETQMYMMSIANHSEQYDATQQYVLSLCENHDIEIELDFLNVDIDGDTATARVRQVTVLTPKDGSQPITYESVLRHDMICRSGIWNILYTYCESNITIYSAEDLLQPIRAGMEAAGHEDVDAYMATINPDSGMYKETEFNIGTIIWHYWLAFDMESAEVLEQNNTSAVIRTVQLTIMTSKKYGETSIYRDTILHELVCINGVWHVDSSTLESSELLSGPAVEDRK